MYSPMTLELRNAIIRTVTRLCDEALALEQPVLFSVERGMREIPPMAGDLYERHEHDGSFVVALRGARKA